MRIEEFWLQEFDNYVYPNRLVWSFEYGHLYLRMLGSMQPLVEYDRLIVNIYTARLIRALKTSEPSHKKYFELFEKLFGDDLHELKKLADSDSL